MVCTPRAFKITDWLEFRNGRASCPCCETEKGKRNYNLSLVPGSDGAYKCHLGHTPHEIRAAIGAPPPGHRSSLSDELPRPKTLTPLADKPKRDCTVDSSYVRRSTERLLHHDGEPQQKALAWLDGRGFTREMVQHYQLGLEKTIVTPDLKQPDKKETYWAIAIFIPVPDRSGRYYKKMRVAPWLTSDERPDCLSKWSQYGVPTTIWFTYKPDDATQTWLTEGEWDAMRLGWLAIGRGEKIAIACSTGGCGTVPPAHQLEQLPGDVVIFYDRNDEPNKNGQRPGDEGALKLASALLCRGRVARVPMPDGCNVKGWDVSNALDAGYNWEDFSAAAAVAEIPKFIQRLEAELHALEAASTDKAATVERLPRGQYLLSSHSSKPPKSAAIAAELAEEYRTKLAWNDREESWYYYEAEYPGVWSSQTDTAIGSVIEAEVCVRIGPIYGSAYITDILRILKWRLLVKRWDERDNLIPVLDGVIDKRTLQLLPHSPTHHLTWSLPIRWSDKGVGCAPIQQWLLEIMHGDSSLIQVLRGVLNAVVNQRADLQRYLEAVGPGGTGKGTFFRLATALVGEDNTIATTLKNLEETRFEVEAMRKAKLVLISEAEKYGGEVNVLKALTGEDKNRVEVKGRQRKCGDDFYFKGFVLVSANEPPQSADYTSGLERRRLSLPFTHKIPSDQRRNLNKEFQPYLAGLLEWVLTMPEEQVTALVRDTDKTVSSLLTAKAETLCDTNPLADWLDNRIIHDPNAKTYVGLDNPDCIERWLYANYTNYMRLTGSRSIGQRRFSKLLEDLCVNQLHLDGVLRDRDRNGSFFQGLRIRDSVDHDPRPITGRKPPSPPDTPPSSGGSGGKRPPAAPTGTPSSTGESALGGDGYVTARTLASDGCDGCDAIFSASSQQNRMSSIELATVESDSYEAKIENLPSHPSQAAVIHHHQGLDAKASSATIHHNQPQPERQRAIAAPSSPEPAVSEKAAVEPGMVATNPTSDEPSAFDRAADVSGVYEFGSENPDESSLGRGSVPPATPEPDAPSSGGVQLLSDNELQGWLDRMAACANFDDCFAYLNALEQLSQSVNKQVWEAASSLLPRFWEAAEIDVTEETVSQPPTGSPVAEPKSISRPALRCDAAPSATAPTLKTGMWVRCVDGFYGYLGARIQDGRWWVLSAKSLRRDATSRIYATTDITPMPIS